MEKLTCQILDCLGHDCLKDLEWLECGTQPAFTTDRMATMSSPGLATPAIAAPPAASGMPALTGVRRTAILLVSIGAEDCAAVLRHMSEEEVHDVTREISRLGVVSRERYSRVLEKRAGMGHLGQLLRETKLLPTQETNEHLGQSGLDAIKNPTTLEELLKRPGVTMSALGSVDKRLAGIQDSVAYQVELDVKYRGYTDRQTEMISRARKLEERRIPPDISYGEIPGLSTEIIEKLSKIKPVSLGQASRISGVTPAAVTALLIHFKKRGLL